MYIFSRNKFEFLELNYYQTNFIVRKLNLKIFVEPDFSATN